MKRATLLLTTLLASISMSATTFAGGDKSFSDVDKDGDQNISQKELQEAGKDNMNLDRHDEDSDGVLSEEEFQQAQDQSQSQGQSQDQSWDESQ